MAEQSFPFENIDTTESQFSEWATNFQETGVQGSPTGTELGITVTGSDLNLTIAAGQAFIRGHYYINTSDLVIAVPTAGVNTRIDILVVELNPETNTIVTKLVSGEAVSADPVAPTLTQSATGIYQLPIATLTIPTSTVVITAGMLVDTRTFMGNRIGIWTTATRPANPTAYQTLGYNTTIESHESWNGTAWVGFFDPITTEGDLVVGDATGQASRLGVGADDQVLTVVDGAPAWADGGASGNYYNITEPVTHTVDLDAGFYNVESIGLVTVEGVEVDGNLGLKEFDSGIETITTTALTFDMTSRTYPFGTDVFALTYGNGVFVAAGTSGNMATSPDGITWTSRTSGIGNTTAQALTYGGGVFVVAGYDGDLASSPDGTTWTSRSSGLTARIKCLTYGDGLFLAGDYDGLIISSPDGTTWTDRTSPFTENVMALAYGAGLFVAFGPSGAVFTSPDGENWTGRTTAATDWQYALTYGDGLFVSVGGDGELTTSPDGITWTSRTSGFGSTNIRGVAYGQGLYIAVGWSGTLTTSPDGITWTSKTSEFGSTNIQVATYGDGLFVIAGDDGEISTTPSRGGVAKLFLDPKLPLTNLPS